MCLTQPFQLLTGSPVPVKDNTCNKNENETLQQIMKKKLKLDDISATKKERKKDGNRQTNNNLK